ncbi:hypothetical protein ParKJ_37025 [Paraburkholderia fungorum]|jgi:hypothetical protein|uniref:DUF6602 domain-containing protein n=1 Tax=Paraburkholderia fungorum TaxID=134537 RepID=A0AAP5UXJ3_9BURK|nr:DUF6602 domain-containing protein [Paraburkholderia fungorum]MDT8843045.1 hypothetical protein [Paraburkholderia fungorum]
MAQTATQPSSVTDHREVLQLSLQPTTAASLWATFQESAASARPDHKGDPREARVRQFLRERLPSKWGVTRGHVFDGDTTSLEFDVLVHDAHNCPGWTLDSTGDPRRLVPLQAVVGVMEVKSTLDDGTLAAAVDKLAQFDALVAEADCEGLFPFRPFRHVFAYRLDLDADFDGWGSPAYRLTRYAGTRCQPDGVFVLNDHFAVLDRGNGIARSFALHRGLSVGEVHNESWDIQNEEIKRFIETDPSHCNDYFATAATDGLLLLAFLTFVLEGTTGYTPQDVDYADAFCRWGGPQLGGLLDFRGPPDPGFPPVLVPEA